jgi:WD40 repeat protein
VTRNFDSFGEHIRPEIKIWDMTQNKLLRTIPVAEETMDAMVLTPDAQCIVTASLTRYDVRLISLREVATGKTIRTFPAYTDEITRLAFAQQGRSLIAMGSTSVLVWDLESGVVRDSLKTENEAHIAACEVQEDGRVLMIVDSLGTVTMRELASVVPLYSIPVDRGDDMFSMGQFAFSKDASCFVTEKRDSIIVRETSTGNVINAWYRHGRGTRTTEFSSDNKSILSHPGLNEVQVWNIAAHKCVIDKGGQDSYYGYFSPDGKRAILTHGKLVDVYDASSGAMLDSFNHRDGIFDFWGSVYDVVCSPDNKTMLSGRKKVQVWKLN